MGVSERDSVARRRFYVTLSMNFRPRCSAPPGLREAILGHAPRPLRCVGRSAETRALPASSSASVNPRLPLGLQVPVSVPLRSRRPQEHCVLPRPPPLHYAGPGMISGLGICSLLPSATETRRASHLSCFPRLANGDLPSRPGLSGTPGMPGFAGRPGRPGLSGGPGRPGFGGWSHIRAWTGSSDEVAGAILGWCGARVGLPGATLSWMPVLSRGPSSPGLAQLDLGPAISASGRIVDAMDPGVFDSAGAPHPFARAPDRLLRRVAEDFGRPPLRPHPRTPGGRRAGTPRGRRPSGAGCRAQGGWASHEGTSAASAVNDVRYRLDRTRRRSPSSLAYLLVKRSIATHSPFMSHTRCAHDTLALPNGNDRIACDRLRVHFDFSRRSRCVLSIWRRRSELLSRRLLLVQPAHDVGLPC